MGWGACHEKQRPICRHAAHHRDVDVIRAQMVLRCGLGAASAARTAAVRCFGGCRLGWVPPAGVAKSLDRRRSATVEGVWGGCAPEEGEWRPLVAGRRG